MTSECVLIAENRWPGVRPKSDKAGGYRSTHRSLRNHQGISGVRDMSVIKKFVKDAAGRLGYTVIPSWRGPNLARAQCIAKVFECFAIDTVIDVGANEGQFIDFLRLQIGFTGRILSFEPVSDLFAALSRKAASDPLLSVFPYALGEAEGEAEINVAALSVFSSFLEPRNAVAQFVSENKPVRRETVQVRRLDDVVPPDIKLAHTYLKLDTQGYDLAVAHGGPRSLGAIPALQTEVSMVPIYENMPSFVDALTFFGRHGFAVSDFHVVTQDEHLRAIEFDCIMVRSPSRG
jgi:FkbM family methyltransferase